MLILRKIIFSFYIFIILFNLSFGENIKWYSFEEGLKKAREENKLILMDIYAKWCHWCNVIENTTYRDKEVINLINKYYIPVRVDAEKRPDINKKYNQGGLPSTLILDKNGNILFGAIYVSPEEMRNILKKYATLSQEDIKKLAEKNNWRKELKLKRLKKKLKSKEISIKEIKKSYRYIKLRYDYEFGGLKGAPKFPKVDIPYFLMIYGLIFEDKEAKKLAIHTLKAYENLIDKVEGGIFRYSVNIYWTEPHYEKLLKDQAELSILYFNAYSLYGKKEFLKDANLLIKFTKNKLYNKKTGYFYNSQGADIVDNEGTLLMTGEEFFIKNMEEREKIIKELGYSPRIEKTVYYGNNLLMVSALTYSYIYNNNNKDLKIAEKLINNILKEGLKEKGIIHSKDIKEYYLSNQVYFLDALLNLYQTTGDIKYLEFAEKEINILDKYYYSKELGIYVDLKDKGINISRISFIDDIFSLNSKLVRNLYQLAVFTGNKYYFKKAEKLTRRLPKSNKFYTSIAYFINLYPPTVIHIVDIPKNKNYLIKNSFEIFPFYNYSQFIDLNNSNFAKKVGYTKRGIYICNIKICFSRVRNTKNLKTEIFRILKSYKLFLGN